MADPKFETLIEAAFAAPASPAERPDLTRAVLDRVAREERLRAIVVTAASLTGAAITAFILTAAGAIEPLTAWAREAWSLAGQIHPPQTPWPLAIAGLSLLALASLRLALREL